MQWKLLIWLLVHNSHECCFIIMTGEFLMGSRTISWAGPLKLQCMYTSWRSYWNSHSHPVVLGWNLGCCVNSKYTYRWCQYYWATHHTLNCTFLDYKPTMPICWARKLLQWKQLPSLISFTVQISVKSVALGRLLWICSSTSYDPDGHACAGVTVPSSFHPPTVGMEQLSVFSPRKNLHPEFHLEHSRRPQKALWPQEIKIP